jgi:hypothetical protein
MPNYEDRPYNDDGTIRVVDQDIIDADRLKGKPRSVKEAAERYWLMQATQLIRYVRQNRL